MNSNKLWKWTSKQTENAVFVLSPGDAVIFNRIHSRGTAVAIGDITFTPNNHYYWEIQILSSLYGTDTMIGVGTKNVDSSKGLDSYQSFLGSDSESYGYSFKGKKQHDGIFSNYGPPFKRRSIIGVHLDMWHGTIEFYLNRKPLGIAFKNLKCKENLHPMICSTAAKCSMKLTYYNSQPASLYMHMIKYFSCHADLLKKIESIPGFSHLFNKELFWLLLPVSGSDIPRDHYDSLETFMALMSEEPYYEFIIGQTLKNNPNERLQEFPFPIQSHDSLQSLNILSQIFDHSLEEDHEDVTMDVDGSDHSSSKALIGDDSAINCNSVKFSGLSKTLCEVCRVNRAALINDQQVTLNMCLGCFYKVD